jgi:hypothetical protein
MHVRVSHSFKQQILEVIALIRVLNNYYYKKKKIQEKIRPTILQKFTKEIQTVKKRDDWFFTLPSLIEAINKDFISQKDSFRFPDSIFLFEAWMNLGVESLFPKMVVQFKFPGFLKGEETRHIFQFIFSTSRGISFPISFAPKFYGYNPPFIKYLHPLFGWLNKIPHVINFLLFQIENKLNIKRHHPGEFESVLVSEYEENVYRGIDTLFHGYFTDEPKKLGQFNSLENALENLIFSYRIGDHAMNIISSPSEDTRNLKVPLIDCTIIKEKYEVNFYAYIKKLMEVNTLLSKRKMYYRRKRKQMISNLPIGEKMAFWFSILKCKLIPGQSIPERFQNVEQIHKHKHLIERLRKLLWVTPLYAHTIHDPSRLKESFKFSQKVKDFNDFEYDISSKESIFLSFIRSYEKEHEFSFKDKQVLNAVKGLRDKMAKMWLYFKERYFKYALNQLKQMAEYSINDERYKKKIKDHLKNLIPIMAVFEIFIRPLSESVYPESVPQTKRLGAHLAKFLTSKYNPLGLSLIKFFNNLAYRNWSYLITQKELNMHQFFNYIVNLPIWDDIPPNIKEAIRIDSSFR